MNLEQILENGYVVAADDWLNVIVVWNGSGTFQAWSVVADSDNYRLVETFLRPVLSAFEAKQKARKWIQNVYEEMDGYSNQEAA